jgi:hypothetical protein
MENPHKVFNLIILDESGSMESIKTATIKGFNEVIQTVGGIEGQFPEQEHLISFVTFNGLDIKTHLFNEPVNNIQPVNENSYKPEASTPLYDAMGFSITKLRTVIEKYEKHNVLVTILTDGEENASREYNGAAIKKLVEELKKKGWTFTYIGANHDVDSFADSLSIKNKMNYMANEADVKRMWAKENSSRFNYSQKIRNNENVSEDYYEDDKEKKENK